MAGSLSLLVNGQSCAISAPAQTPLLWLLRDELACSSPKYGCGLEQCGACAVLIDDTPSPSCRVSVGAVAGRRITTHEGLAGDAVYEAVVEALARRNAGQCGYCLPGIVIALVALARRPARPGRQEVLDRLDEHLCRCGSQPRVLLAAQDVLEDPR